MSGVVCIGMPSKPTFEVFQDGDGDWRWRLVATNGNIIADSGEGYTTKQGVKRGIQSVKTNAPQAEITVVDTD